MKNALRGEIRKLFTVKSTYLLSLVALLLIVLGSFVGSGFILKEYDKHFVINNGLSTVSAITYFIAISSVLLMAHEYRHKTIFYTLTFQKNRSTVLLAKLFVVIVYSALFTLFAVFLGIGLALLGAQIAGHTVPPQEFNLLPFLAMSIFYSTAFAVGALLITTLIRNMTGSIAAIFIIPNAVEGLLGALLKDRADYLPFTALNQLIVSPTSVNDISPLKGAIIFMVYLVVGWLIAWRLFLRKDAT